jgi:hypothetical protein
MTIDTNNDLSAARNARAAARDRLQAAQAALERAQRVARESSAEAERRAGARRAADQAHVTAVESWIAGGCVGDRPARVDDPAIAEAEARARAEHEVTATALKSLEAARERAQAELAESEGRVREAVTAILLADATRLAAEIVELEQKAVALRLDLIGIVDHPLVITKHSGIGLPPELSRGLHHPRVPGSHFFLPRYAKELFESDPACVALAQQRWLKRVDELVDAPAETEPTESQPCAAA